MLAAVQDRGSARRSMTTGLPWGLAAVLIAAPALAAGPADDATEDGPPAEVASDSTETEPTETAPSEADSTETEPTETEADSTETEPTETETEAVDAPSPPRIDGVYLGGTVFGGVGILRVNDLVTGTPFATFGATITVGQMVFPWLGLGLHGGGGGGVRSEEGARQTLGQGYVGMDFKFVPAPQRLPLSLRASFGFGGGAVRQEGITNRSGFGGAQFGAGIRYELFPFAKRFRPYRGGGFGLGPELGWIGFTPAAAGRPMSNVIYLALSTTFYFGS